MAVDVSDKHSNREEHIERAVKLIGRSKAKLGIFQAVYRGKKAWKTKEQIRRTTGLTETRFLNEAQRLVDGEVITRKKVGAVYSYGQGELLSGEQKRGASVHQESPQAEGTRDEAPTDSAKQWSVSG